MKNLKNKCSFLMIIIIVLLLTACGGKKETIHYADAESFEAALNDGENLEGRIVRFAAIAMTPDSAFGYNIWAGEHLNFVSADDPGVKEGDTVVVKATAIEQVSGSWIIQYEKADQAVMGGSTIVDSSEASGDVTNNRAGKRNSPDISGYGAVEDSTVSSKTDVANDSDSAAKSLELADSGWCLGSQSGDIVYIDFCGMIHNPNEGLVAEFPRITVTARHGDGSILATDTHVGSIVMPGDTVTLCHTFSMPISGLTDDLQIEFDVDWSDWASATSIDEAAKTTDFTITNVTERNGKNQSFVTGEITSHYAEKIDQINLSMIFRKDGEIVYIENIFLDSLKPGKTKAFEFSQFGEWPEHDAIELSAMVW